MNDSVVVVDDSNNDSHDDDNDVSYDSKLLFLVLLYLINIDLTHYARKIQKKKRR